MNEDFPQDPASGANPLRDEAALWFARMRGDRADQFRDEFEKWLSRGALHRAAYNRIGEVFALSKVLKGETDADPTGIAPRDRTTRLPLTSLVVLGVALAVSLGTAWCWLGQGAPSLFAPANAQTVTRIGQIERLEPAAGLQVTLDTNSLLVTKVGGASNVMKLERGRARFAFAHVDPAVVVDVGGLRTRTRDATFDLSIAENGAVEAAVWRGNVDVMSIGGAGRHPLGAKAVPAGNRLAIDRAGRPARSHYNAGRAWTQGILEFDRTPLGDVLNEANRYSVTQIVLGDPELGRFLVSGRFRIDDPSGLARRLALALALTADRSSGDRIVLDRAR